MSTDDNPLAPGIRRGPMASDHFTLVANLVARDPNLSLGAKGLFLNLASHRDGYPITENLVVRQCADGVKSVRKYLAELREHGYVYRGARRPNPASAVDANGKSIAGLLGPYTYFVTDQPEEINQILRQNQREAKDEQST